jgi:hypothetical protein
MAHKMQTIKHAKDFLQQLSLTHIFSQKDFEHYYRKHGGAWGNAFHTGIGAAEFMMRQMNDTMIQEHEASLKRQDQVYAAQH